MPFRDQWVAVLPYRRGDSVRGDEAMPDYRLYHFKGSHIGRVDNVSAPNDQEAIRKAEQLVDGQVAELWRGGRKVETFNP